MTILKLCFKCDWYKPTSEFYKHSAMADGYLGKCKTCSKIDSTKHRNNNINEYRKYDVERGNRLTKGYYKKYRKKNPIRYKATNAVNNAIRDKRLSKEPCEVCGEKEVHAHHDDYRKPLNVRWLCPAHHSQLHAKMKL